jgi:NAD(P)-dependent dehydrogenase (short-subunit alcohol dehydrogenase family)
MKDRVCLVTGANTGVGFETARALARLGATVVMAGRRPEKLAAAVNEVRREYGNARVEELPLNLAATSSIRDAAAQFRASHPRLDVLVNNAGLVLSDRRTTEDGFEMTIGVNHLGHFLLTHLLRDSLDAAKNARVVNVASQAHRSARRMPFDDLMKERTTYHGWRTYAESKLANILFTRELARRWKSSGIVSNAVHPGVVNTRFVADGDTKGFLRFAWDLMRPFMLTPRQGAATTVHVATSIEGAEVTGRYFVKSRQTEPSAAAKDDKAAARLWEVSETLLGLG